jgi:hypothetical protein
MMPDIKKYVLTTTKGQVSLKALSYFHATLKLRMDHGIHEHDILKIERS